MDISRTTFVLNQDVDQTRFTKIAVNIARTYHREVLINLHDNVFEGIIMNQSPLMDIYGSSKVSVSIHNLSFDGASFSESILQFTRLKEVAIDNISFSNITEFGRSLLRFTDVEGVDINHASMNICSEACEFTDTK